MLMKTTTVQTMRGIRLGHDADEDDDYEETQPLQSGFFADSNDQVSGQT